MRYFIALAVMVTCGCSTINVTIPGSSNYVTIEQPKTVTASPYAAATGNTVPITPKLVP